MSEDTLNLILQRLDSMDREQKQQFAHIDQRFEVIEREQKQQFARIDQRFEVIEREQKQQFARIDQRFEVIEREQTRLRVDMVNQMERVLSEIHTFKDDVTVAMAFAARADAGNDASATLQRSKQSQLSQLRHRIQRLEDRSSGTT